MLMENQKFLCAFKCPFCGDKVTVASETQPDNWVKVHGFCEGQREMICAVGFDFGTFGPGFTIQARKESVMDVVGINFIN
jgi:hypothetical protein